MEDKDSTVPLEQKIEKFWSLRALVAGIIQTFICIFSLHFSHMAPLTLFTISEVLCPDQDLSWIRGELPRPGELT